ncbi:TPA: aminoacyl-tRNA hydrolase [Legionella feeleii]|uniref:Peptidyl-tRNA hydrolase n=1 Tax=Legionella feeleii TaxID=453 RepID=A0A0W0TL78_9GAMM|nr:aminoacyl-tRNA hydrolase [Legionella feeleii]KTC96385.1 peptidyl-tRNA hydrolase [Legionella feeleii]SPX61936.1 peptidyl-tRNA hydrolase [Legionella feeleii]
MAIKLIVGLRNPGSAYEQTRHNAGAWFVEALAERYKASFKTDKKLHGDIANLEIDHLSCKALLPLTFMNHSGLAAKETSQFYRIKPNEILIVHDDLALPAGRIKLKTGGGHGGHNGLRDLIAHLGSAEFHRLRVGIGHPGHKDMVLNYVLGKPSQQDRQLIVDALEKGLEVMPAVLAGQLAAAMNTLNG